MINAQQVQEILLQYKKHGWNLRRVLLSAETNNLLSVSLKNLFGDAEIISSEIDAAWFSRPSGADNEAWEIRRLSGTPFALVEVFEIEDDEEVREEARKEMETRLGQSASKTRDWNSTV
jgi:hypothetical protein